MTKLKPCPFCGGEEANVSNWGMWRAWCAKCNATASDHLTEKEAAAAWNRRADRIRDTTKKVSNADRIRGMSDEELAEFLWEQNGNNRYWKSVGKYLDWLKAETEGTEI